MLNTSSKLFIIGILYVVASACSQGDAQKGTNTAQQKPAATPAKNFTTADVAKLKWIEGTWRGMDGDKPFYERYKIEENAMVVEGLADETVSKVTDSLPPSLPPASIETSRPRS